MEEKNKEWGLSLFDLASEYLVYLDAENIEYQGSYNGAERFYTEEEFRKHRKLITGLRRALELQSKEKLEAVRKAREELIRKLLKLSTE